VCQDAMRPCASSKKSGGIAETGTFLTVKKLRSNQESWSNKQGGFSKENVDYNKAAHQSKHVVLLSAIGIELNPFVT